MAMKAIVSGHLYELENGTRIEFVHRTSSGHMWTDNTTTTEEILEVLVHRIAALQFMHPCEENVKTIAHLKMAMKHQKDRKQRQTPEEIRP